MLCTAGASRDDLELVITSDCYLHNLLAFARVKFKTTVIVNLYRFAYDRCFISDGPTRFEDALHT